MGDDSAHIQFVKASLQRYFDITDLDLLHYFLRSGVAYGLCGYLLSQQKDVTELISIADLSDETTADTPMQFHQKLTPNIGEPLANLTRYHESIGPLVYLTITRLHIAYVVYIVSLFV